MVVIVEKVCVVLLAPQQREVGLVAGVITQAAFVALGHEFLVLGVDDEPGDNEEDG